MHGLTDRLCRVIHRDTSAFAVDGNEDPRGWDALASAQAPVLVTGRARRSRVKTGAISVFAAIWSEMPRFRQGDCCSPLMCYRAARCSDLLLITAPGPGIRLVAGWTGPR